MCRRLAWRRVKCARGAGWGETRALTLAPNAAVGCGAATVADVLVERLTQLPRLRIFDFAHLDHKSLIPVIEETLYIPALILDFMDNIQRLWFI